MDRIDALYAYVRAVELGSFSRVASEIRVKQSTVSKWIATLERQLGVQLIERVGRSQRITDAGSTLYRAAKEILDTLAAAEADVQNVACELRGRIRVSLPVVFGQRYIVPEVATFMRRHPSLELELVLDDRYVRLLDEGFDVAIRVGKPADSSLHARTLARAERRLVASREYVERYGTPDTPEDLKLHACVLHSGLDVASVWLFHCDGAIHQAETKGRLSANNSEAVLTMVRAGLGIALLASWLVDADLASGELVRLLPDYEPPSAPVQALTAPSRYMQPRVNAFIDFMKEALCSLR